MGGTISVNAAWPLLVAAAMLMAACATARAFDAPPPESSEAVEENEAHAWLGRLEERGAAIESLQASVSHVKTNRLTTDRQTRLGSASYQSADEESGRPARFAIRFDRLLLDDGRMHERAIDYIFDGTWLVERNDEMKVFDRRQVVRPGQTIDPLQIDGPFPIPIGQKRADVLARFDADLVDDPADAERYPGPGPLPVHLRLTPRADVPQEGRVKLQSVDMWVDRDLLLPVRIKTVERAEDTLVVLSNIRVNELGGDEAEAMFDTTAPPEGAGWDVIVRPFDEGR